MSLPRILKLDAHIYRNFDVDYTLDAPAEAVGGWTTTPVELPLEETALVSMHALECGTPESSPAYYRSVEYLTRKVKILETVFPPLLSAAREAGMTVLHMVSEGEFYRDMPGYRHAAELAWEEPEFTGEAPHSDNTIRLRRLQRTLGTPGERNIAPRVEEGARFGFAPQARPLPGEGIAATGAQLSALCRERGVSHLVYIGFSLNSGILASPGGMRDMYRRWYLCSTIREATTAHENKESIRTEAHKEEALWRVSTDHGFVFDVEPFIAALKATR